MKRQSAILLFALAALIGTACGMFQFPSNIRTITPSDNIISETRDVSGFTGVDLSSFGTVTITQGDSESLVVKGSDNVLPLVTTTVQNGVLVIGMKENVTFSTFNREDVLSFQIGVKDLKSLTVSGLGAVKMNGLTTSAFQLAMSGAGGVEIQNLAADQLNVDISGLGGATISGTATNLKLTISGAGKLTAPDLQCQTADVSIPGLGGATIWVTDKLTGSISGAGNVQYYGDPQTSTNSTGLGKFESLGNK